MPPERRLVLTADSITRVGAEANGAVVVSGSHGGLYAAYLAAKLGVAAATSMTPGSGATAPALPGSTTSPNSAYRRPRLAT